MSVMLNILIATNTNYLSNLIKDILHQQGFNICGIAKSKEELFEMCISYYPEIIILDLGLQNKKNFSKSPNIIEELLLFDEDLLIITIGDDISDNFKASILNYGAKEYLCKPFQPANLWERVNRVINTFIINENKKTNSVSCETINDKNRYLNLPQFSQKHGDILINNDLENEDNVLNISENDLSENIDSTFKKFLNSLFNKLK